MSEAEAVETAAQPSAGKRSSEWAATKLGGALLALIAVVVAAADASGHPLGEPTIKLLETVAEHGSYLVLLFIGGRSGVKAVEARAGVTP